MIWPPAWLIRRRHRKFHAKLARISADMAAHSARHTLTIKEATARLSKALQTPSDPIR